MNTIMEYFAKDQLPLLARGADSSLSGQAIAAALIVDCSLYFNRLVTLNADAGMATMEPGLVLDLLNRAASRHGLQLGPDSASAERTTLGSCIGHKK